MSIRFVPFNIPYDPTRDPVEEAFAKAVGGALETALVAPIARKATTHEYSQRIRQQHALEEDLLKRIQESTRIAHEDWRQRQLEYPELGVRSGQLQKAPEFLPEGVSTIEYQGEQYIPIEQATQLGLEFSRQAPIRQSVANLNSLLGHKDLPDLDKLGQTELFQLHDQLNRELAARYSGGGSGGMKVNPSHQFYLKDLADATAKYEGQPTVVAEWTQPDGSHQTVMLPAEWAVVLQTKGWLTMGIRQDAEGNAIQSATDPGRPFYGSEYAPQFTRQIQIANDMIAKFGDLSHLRVVSGTEAYKAGVEGVRKAMAEAEVKDWYAAAGELKVGGASLQMLLVPQMEGLLKSMGIDPSGMSRDKMFEKLAGAGGAAALTGAVYAAQLWPTVDDYVAQYLADGGSETIPPLVKPLLQQIWQAADAQRRMIPVDQLNPMDYNIDAVTRRLRADYVGGSIGRARAQRDMWGQYEPPPELFGSWNIRALPGEVTVAAGMPKETADIAAERVNRIAGTLYTRMKGMGDKAEREAWYNNMVNSLDNAIHQTDQDMRNRIKGHVMDVYASIPAYAQLKDKGKEDVLEHTLDQMLILVKRELEDAHNVLLQRESGMADVPAPLEGWYHQQTGVKQRSKRAGT